MSAILPEASERGAARKGKLILRYGRPFPEFPCSFCTVRFIPDRTVFYTRVVTSAVPTCPTLARCTRAPCAAAHQFRTSSWNGTKNATLGVR